MTELTDFTDPTPDLTDEEISLIRRAGGSEHLIRVCNCRLDELQQNGGTSVTSNSALKEVKKYLREWENLTEEKVDDFNHLGGSYFTELWNGNLYAAYSRADSNNSQILLETFSVVEINQDRPNHAPRVQA